MEQLIILLDKHPILIPLFFILFSMFLFFFFFTNIEINFSKFLNIKLERKTISEKKLYELENELKRLKYENEVNLFHLTKSFIIQEAKLTAMMITMREKAVKDYIRRKFEKELEKEFVEIIKDKEKLLSELNVSSSFDYRDYRWEDKEKQEDFAWGTIEIYKL